MSIYEELLRTLSGCPDAEYGCSNCKYRSSIRCREELMSEAADAIEELSSAGSIYGKAWTLGYDAGRDENKPRWIPVTERLPEIGKKVLVLAYQNDVVTARLQKQTENGFPVFECNGIFLEMAKPGRITRWMPLPSAPEPPKEDE